MEEAPNEASWSQSRQAEEGEGLIEGETHRGGWRERKRGEKGVRHAGCMAAQAALLYQEAPVGVFLPNSAEKAKAMPNSTSANRAAITSLIDVFLFWFSPPHSRHVGRQSIIIMVERMQSSTGCFFLFHCSDLIQSLKLPGSLQLSVLKWSDILLETHHTSSAAVSAPQHAAWMHTRWLNMEG